MVKCRLPCLYTWDFFSLSSQTAELIRALQELENAASSDSALRQRISSLPAEVQDTSLLHKITGSAERKRKQQFLNHCEETHSVIQ